MLPGRTLHGIVKQFYSSMVKVKPGAKVITIEPAQNASTIEWVVRLLSAAFERICAECLERILLSRQKILQLSGQLSLLLMLCGCTIVSARPSAIVSTIGSVEDA